MIDTNIFQDKTAVYYTLGCKLNFSETSTIGCLLQEAGIPVQYDEAVHHIINRDHTGWCPLEQASRDLYSVQEIYPVIQSFITRQRKQG